MISRALRLARETSGNVGIIFALAAMPLIAGAGAALDYSRASNILASLQAGTDATTLLLCQASSTTSNTDLRARALVGVQSYVQNNTVAIDTLNVTNSPRAVTLTASTVYQTAFMKIMNQNTVPISATAACSARETYFEIALVLDTTGSMSGTAGTTTKMEATKTAAKGFVDYMYSTGAQPGHVRMSLVPFAASVRIPTSSRTASWLDTTGAHPLHWQYFSDTSNQGFSNRLKIFDKLGDNRPEWDWNGCVESPTYPYNVNDDAVSSGKPGSLFMPLLAPDEPPAICYFLGIPIPCTPPNNYIEDGTSSNSSASCSSNYSVAMGTRLTQACKYKTLTPVSTPGTPNYGCRSRALSQLGISQTSIKSEIDALQPDGQTNIHEGFMWGWRTISPTSVFSTQTDPPATYGKPNTQKIIVLMTDGDNTWSARSGTVGGSEYGPYGYFKNADGTSTTSANSRFIPSRTAINGSEDARDAMDELTRAACTNAKDKKIVIYTVAFSTRDAPISDKGLQLISDCATGPDYTFVKSDAAGVIAAFQVIASGIGALRLTK